MRAAIFDIDGVLTKGFAIRHFWNHLAEKGIIDASPLLTSKKIFDKFHKGEISYREMGNNVMELVALAFRGASQKEVDSESKNFFRSNKIDLFDYTIPLISLLKKQKLKIIAVSGSTIEFLENYKELLGFDVVFGTELEIVDGKYTGSLKTRLGTGESKKKVLQSLSGMDRFIGFGDTEQDIPILESVKVPVALNPNKELESAATEKGWKILRETDDVVEEVRRLL
ncbi:MAG: HAD family phosphatase [Candidatus Aenigmarchaeota archaeon]|nr:HAD family phosphatase [Candidatus Aenigmarchaeota archaeon]